MTLFDIKKPDGTFQRSLQSKIDRKTKPVGSLGKLEEIALQIGSIQQNLSPRLNKPTMLVFAGDHGIAKEGLVNPYPQEVTAQMVYNFLNGGAAINTFCQQHDLQLQVIDAGVNHDFPETVALVHAKIDYGTRNFLHDPAMTPEQCTKAIQSGAEVVRKLNQNGTNVVGVGEMGIGNTSSSALLMHSLTGIPLVDCTGKGTGLNQAGLALKLSTLNKAIETHGLHNNPFNALATFGGFEIAMMVGAFLKGATLKMVCLVDGFISTVAALVAAKMHPEMLSYAVFSHESEERGHQLVLRHLAASPILHLNMRLGEASGAAVCYPIIKSAVTFLNQMASFEEAEVSRPD